MVKLRTIFVSAALLLASAIPLNANAQAKGEMSLGVAGGFDTYNTGGFASAFFQFSVLPHLRLAPEVGYVFRNQGNSAFTASCDLHFPYRIARGLNIYPLVGLTMNAWNRADDPNLIRFGGDFGGGMELYITGNLKINLQGKFSWMRDTSGGFFSFGIAYILK